MPETSTALVRAKKADLAFFDNPAAIFLTIGVIAVGGGVVYYFVKKKPSTIIPTASATIVIPIPTAEEQSLTKGLTPAQAKTYIDTLSKEKDPEKLEEVAKRFDAIKKPQQAKVLRKRAAVAKLPKAQQKARRTVMKKALKSSKPAAVRKVALAFEGEGCIGAATALRDYANTLEVLQSQ